MYNQRNGIKKRLREAYHTKKLWSGIPNHARPAGLIRLANDADLLSLPSCDAIISPMHEPEASPACARPTLIKMGPPNKYISLHAPVGWSSASYLSLTSSRSIDTIPHTAEYIS
jgi:hypothetical protein